MKYFQLLICLWALSAFQAVGQPTLSSQSHISLITCGPGEDLFTAFGHSAIRIYDPVMNIDLVYNYGVFDFDDPNLIPNFVKGRPIYIVARNKFPRFRQAYIHHNRSLREQVLNLDSLEKAQVFAFLENNILQVNRSYQYHYFKNNCSTKIKDVFQNILGGQLQFDSTYLDERQSFRQIVHDYLPSQPWGKFGIDICLGLPIDAPIPAEDYMFHPEKMEVAFRHATILRNGKSESLVEREIPIFAAAPIKNSFNPGPILVFSFLALIGFLLFLYEVKNTKWFKAFDFLWLLVFGMAGAIFLYLWAFSDHEMARPNFNLMWALPTHLLMAFAIFLVPQSKQRPYWIATLVLAALMILLWFALPQTLNWGVFPLGILAAIRAYGALKRIPKR